MRKHELLYALNTGGVDPEAISRVDLEKMRLAGEHPVANFLPRVLGPVTLFPGSENLAAIPGSAETRFLKFVRSTSNSYMLLLTPGEMRIMLDGAIQQVPDVSTEIDISSWVDVSTSPATATGGATLTFSGTRTASAKLRQAVTVAVEDQSVENILRVVVSRGVLYLRIGTTAGGTDLVDDARLDTGTHKISVVPGASTIYVELRSDEDLTRTVSEIQFEAVLLGGAGDLVIPTPWSTIAAVKDLRTWQSLDVIFAGDGASQPRRIEHRGPLSWGIAVYKTSNGPFTSGSPLISLTPAALSGNTTITASEALFKAGHVGGLLELTQTGKTVTSTLNALGQTSDYVTIIGIDGGRIFTRTGVGTAFVGTIVLERSFDSPDPLAWTTYATFVDGAATFSTTSVDDDQDNVKIHYRYRVSAYTSGTADMTLVYDSGVQVGRARIVGYTSSTVVSVETLVSFGNTSSTRSWRKGDWSDADGWPRTPIIHDGRLHWFQDDTDYASKPDDYTYFDDELEGDSGPITRSVGTGGDEGVTWALSQGRLIVGTPAFEAAIAANDIDQPLTPTAYTVRKISRRGSADVQAVEHDDGFFFLQRSLRRVYEVGMAEGRFKSRDISRLNPAAFRAGVTEMAVQQQPDTRLYCVLTDGSLVIVTHERDDEVAAITTRTITGGLVEDVEVLPNTSQDDVYLIVNRGGTRYIERFAAEALQTSVSTCTLLDGHKVLTGSISGITGATHFANSTVQVWADGVRRSDVAINGSGIGTLGATYSRVVYGKSYNAVFKTSKLAFAAALGSALSQAKIVHGASVILANSCMDGILIGRDASNTDPLPAIIDGAARTTGQMFTHYDSDIFPINSTWDADARLYISVNSAYGPVTIQAVALDIETRDGAGKGGQ